MEIQDSDILIIHRLTAPRSHGSAVPANSNKARNPAIIVKFTRCDIRNRFYKSTKRLLDKTTKDVGFHRSHDQKIYISESPTQHNKKSFNRCLQVFKSELNYKFLWTSNGNILLRKDSSHPVMKINSQGGSGEGTNDARSSIS